jgi:hypothetical protein
MNGTEPLMRGQGEGNGFVEGKHFPHPPLWGTFPQEGKENPDFPRTAVEALVVTNLLHYLKGIFSQGGL